MSTIVVVKKDNLAATAADALTTCGGGKEPAEFDESSGLSMNLYTVKLK